MKKSAVLMPVLLLAGLFAAAAAVDVTGDWTLTMTTPRGEMTQDIKFVQEGEKLTVTMISTRGGSTSETKGEGTVKGNDIEWKITRSTPRGEFTMTYKGQIVDENNLKGTVEGGMGGGMSMEWKAARKPK